MFASKLSKLLILIVVTIIGLLSVSFAVSPKSSQSSQDDAQQHAAEVLVPITGNVDISSADYYQRHRDDPKAVRSPDLTDYFSRHPELTSGSAEAVDTSDYYLRHANER